MIEVDKLCKSFTRVVKDDKNKSSIRKLKKVKTKKEEFFAVNNVSFKVMEGEIVGILGPNGAGKTTLLRMLGGILTPTSGSINISGYDYSIDRNSAKKEIGYLSGNTKLYGRLSPRELLTTFASLYEMSKEDIEESIENIVKIMDMSEFIDNRIENLSTGQTQRTSIARCLIHSPKVYIFDEPTLGLDVLSSASIIDFMKNEKLRGKTVLYSTHYMEEVEILCNHIVIIDQGQVIAEGSKEQLKNMVRENEKLIIEVPGLTEEQVATVEGFPSILEVTYDESYLKITTKDLKKALLPILNYFETEKIMYANIHTQEATLNDVFLEITGTELRD